jgi:hypothetical protein
VCLVLWQIQLRTLPQLAGSIDFSHKIGLL